MKTLSDVFIHANIFSSWHQWVTKKANLLMKPNCLMYRTLRKFCVFPNSYFNK